MDDDLEYETRIRICRRPEGDCCDLSCVLVAWLILAAVPSMASSDGPSLAVNAFGITVVCLPAFLVLCANVLDHVTSPEYTRQSLDQFIPVYLFMILVISALIIASIHAVLAADSQPLPCLLLAVGVVAYYAAFPFAPTVDLETDLVFAVVIAVHVHRGFTLLSTLYALVLAMAIWNRVLA